MQVWRETYEHAKQIGNGEFVALRIADEVVRRTTGWK